MSEIPKMFNSPIHSDERIPYSNWNKALPFRTTNFRKTNFPQFDAQFGGSVPIHASIIPGQRRPHTTTGVEGRKQLIQLRPPPESSKSNPFVRPDVNTGAYSILIHY